MTEPPAEIPATGEYTDKSLTELLGIREDDLASIRHQLQEDFERIAAAERAAWIESWHRMAGRLRAL